MRHYDMKSVYTIAAVPTPSADDRGQVVPLPVEMPYTLADAWTLVGVYNENPRYRKILADYKCSHFVPFNLEALTMEPPAYYVGE